MESHEFNNYDNEVYSFENESLNETDDCNYFDMLKIDAEEFLPDSKFMSALESYNSHKISIAEESSLAKANPPDNYGRYPGYPDNYPVNYPNHNPAYPDNRHGNHGGHTGNYPEKHNGQPGNNLGHPKDGKPTSPPPNYMPKNEPNLKAIDPGAISGCLYNYCYIWLRNRQSFWFYPTFVGPKSISGYRWTRFGWVYAGLNLHMINSFYCK